MPHQLNVTKLPAADTNLLPLTYRQTNLAFLETISNAKTATERIYASMFDSWRGFSEEKLSDEWHRKLTELGRIARGHILKMTTLAASGHPGGSMSSIEIYLMLYFMSLVDPTDRKSTRLNSSH